MTQTIFALASGQGRAGIGVLRLSGPRVPEALVALIGQIPEPRRAVLRRLKSRDGGVLDTAILLYFPAPHSFTGEAVAELHIHGGQAVVAAIVGVLGGELGLRQAEPGEFTKRAFLNGKMDLTRAEGLADLVSAETEAQRRQALRQMAGGLGTLYEDWRQRVISALARFEAEIDFSDQDLPRDLAEHAVEDIEKLRGEMADHLELGRLGLAVREGVSVAILGPPNVGKSSIFNKLIEKDAAIVAGSPGTTRDIVEYAIDLGGVLVVLADTAGIRETGDEVERIGIARAIARAQDADILILVRDATDPDLEVPPDILSRQPILVTNKSDLVAEGAGGGLPVSAVTGMGISALRESIGARARDLAGDSEAPVLTRLRHKELVGAALDALDRVVSGGRGVELMAEDLRLCARALGRITGHVDVEHVLDVVFRDFCIGK